jgi:hypothetical protein
VITVPQGEWYSQNLRSSPSMLLAFQQVNKYKFLRFLTSEQTKRRPRIYLRFIYIIYYIVGKLYTHIGINDIISIYELYCILEFHNMQLMHIVDPQYALIAYCGSTICINCIFGVQNMQLMHIVDPQYAINAYWQHANMQLMHIVDPEYAINAYCGSIHNIH